MEKKKKWTLNHLYFSNFNQQLRCVHVSFFFFPFSWKRWLSFRPPKFHFHLAVSSSKGRETREEGLELPAGGRNTTPSPIENTFAELDDWNSRSENSSLAGDVLRKSSSWSGRWKFYSPAPGCRPRFWQKSILLAAERDRDTSTRGGK